MGTARGSVVLKRIRNTGMLSMQLFTEGGRPLKQTVTGNMVNDDWTQEGNHPKVYPLAQYSRYSDFISEFVSVSWSYDGVPISDSDERFDLTQTVSYGSIQIPCLTIKSNLALDMTSFKLISCTAVVNIDGINENVSATIEVSRESGSEATYMGYISLNPPVFDANITEIQATAKLEKGGDTISNFSVNWYWVVPNDTDGTVDGLEEIESKTNPLIINSSDVDTRGVLVAKFIINGAEQYSAFVAVEDRSDPYEMEFSYDTQFEGVLDEQNGITTTVKVVHRDSRVEATQFKWFAFALMSGSDYINGTGGSKLQNNSFKATKDDFNKAKNDLLNLEIEASDTPN